jgi:hypothetical protein
MSKKLAPKSKPQENKQALFSFENQYPYITRWVRDCGWIEMGDDGCSGSFIKAIDEGGLIWETQKKYKDIDAAFQALEEALAKYIKEQIGE